MNLIHQGLEGHRRIGLAERHDQKFKGAFVRLKRRLRDIIGVNPNLVTARTQIQLGEERRGAHRAIPPPPE
jgi:hypothetical protein